MQDGQTALRLDFPERVTDGTSLRKMLVPPRRRGARQEGGPGATT